MPWRGRIVEGNHCFRPRTCYKMGCRKHWVSSMACHLLGWMGLSFSFYKLSLEHPVLLGEVVPNTWYARKHMGVGLWIVRWPRCFLKPATLPNWDIFKATHVPWYCADLMSWNVPFQNKGHKRWDFESAHALVFLSFHFCCLLPSAEYRKAWLYFCETREVWLTQQVLNREAGAHTGKHRKGNC